MAAQKSSLSSKVNVGLGISVCSTIDFEENTAHGVKSQDY